MLDLHRIRYRPLSQNFRIHVRIRMTVPMSLHEKTHVVYRHRILNSSTRQTQIMHQVRPQNDYDYIEKLCMYLKLM